GHISGIQQNYWYSHCQQSTFDAVAIISRLWEAGKSLLFTPVRKLSGQCWLKCHRGGASMSLRTKVCSFVAGLMSLGLGSVAGAQDYPARTIALIVPFAAGGPTDVVARIIGDHMSKSRTWWEGGARPPRRVSCAPRQTATP